MSGVIVAAAAASAAVAASAPVAAAASPGFIAATIGFFAGFLLTWPALIGLVLLGILFEHNGARGWAVSTALAVAGIAYFFFAVPLLTILIGAVAYVLIGLFWSVWRYKRHVTSTVAKHVESSDIEKNVVLRNLHPKAMLPTITAWILIWPFSFIENIASDLINGIEALVSKFFRGIYHKIYNSAVAALK